MVVVIRDNELVEPVDCQAGSLQSEIMSTPLETQASNSDDCLGGELDLVGAVARRRNFAIISHPDAGKTTLELVLLLSL